LGVKRFKVIQQLIKLSVFLKPDAVIPFKMAKCVCEMFGVEVEQLEN
jgi:hypothetical protein